VAANSGVYRAIPAGLGTRVEVVPKDRLGYEEMLSELHGLLGHKVNVALGVIIAGQLTPAALLSGTLTLGHDGDLSMISGVPTGVPGGESVVFYLDHGHGCFIIRQDDYTDGGWSEEGGVESYVGPSRTTVWPEESQEAFEREVRAKGLDRPSPALQTNHAVLRQSAGMSDPNKKKLRKKAEEAQRRAVAKRSRRTPPRAREKRQEEEKEELSPGPRKPEWTEVVLHWGSLGFAPVGHPRRNLLGALISEWLLFGSDQATKTRGLEPASVIIAAWTVILFGIPRQ
jgi:hypothetical protein